MWVVYRVTLTVSNVRSIWLHHDRRRRIFSSKWNVQRELASIWFYMALWGEMYDVPKWAGEKKPTHFGRHPKLDCLSEKWETLIIYPIKFPVYRYLQCPENISNIRRMATYVTSWDKCCQKSFIASITLDFLLLRLDFYFLGGVKVKTSILN